MFSKIDLQLCQRSRYWCGKGLCTKIAHVKYEWSRQYFERWDPCHDWLVGWLYWRFTSLQWYFSHIATWKQEITNLWKFKWRGRESNPVPLAPQPKSLPLGHRCPPPPPPHAFNKVKGRGQCHIMVILGSSCHKDYVCQIWMIYHQYYIA